MNTIETKNLHFSYGKKQILKGMDLVVPEGSVYGLLGRNGAGKSTSLKLLLGLLPHKHGEILYWGNADYGREIFYKIGNMIETPAVYGYLSVEEHLRMFDIIFKKGPDKINAILQTCGLTEEKNKKASKLSTGLRQRLAIAIALLRDPQILILDEPTNGLDPLGIVEMRELILNLNRKEGRTILLSSHIISEIEKICTHIGILEEGKLAFQDKITEIGEESLENFYMDILKRKKHA
ncbi:MAG: ATP-binding cassette domain-containing protein [Bacteroidales bacterium]|jgi:ABC-2 type transport system ATP-binding protein|nr:ATP-binding cassette domain-containing protein [Bacteroidales bacterium]